MCAPILCESIEWAQWQPECRMPVWYIIMDVNVCIHSHWLWSLDDSDRRQHAYHMSRASHEWIDKYYMFCNFRILCIKRKCQWKWKWWKEHSIVGGDSVCNNALSMQLAIFADTTRVAYIHLFLYVFGLSLLLLSVERMEWIEFVCYFGANTIMMAIQKLPKDAMEKSIAQCHWQLIFCIYCYD